MSMSLPRPAAPAILSITFFYYRDLARAEAFYRDVMGFALAIDQEWAKILRIAGTACIGLVDESRGMHRTADEKPVQLCLRVEDVGAWHAYAKSAGVRGVSELFENGALGIRAFVMNDPEGYQIEMQSVIGQSA